MTRIRRSGAPLDDHRLPFRFGAAAIVLFFGGLALWSFAAELESATIVQGVARPSSPEAAIDHPDGGVVAALLVRDGDRVAKGQALLRLDAREIKGELRTLLRRRDTLQAVWARMEARRMDAPAVDYPIGLTSRRRADPALARMIGAQTMLFQADREAFHGETAIGAQKTLALRERIDGLRAQLASLRAQRAIIEGELADAETLLEKGLTPKDRLLALQRELVRLDGRIGSVTAEIAETKAQIGETELALLQLRRDRAAETSDGLQRTLAELQQLAPKIEVLRGRLARTELRAPATGVVFDLKKLAIGGVVARGEAVMKIMPDPATLIIEARIAPRDRDSLRENMIARVRPASSSGRREAELKARLIGVSADALFDETTRESFFVGRVALDAPTQTAALRKLTPGAPVEVFLPHEARTPFEYLVEPLIRSAAKAFNER